MTQETLHELALFAGVGGGLLGTLACGLHPVCAVELDKYAREVLLARQRDGFFPRFPIWDDVCTFDGTLWRGRVDVVSGGFPCQDISSAGKRTGIEGPKSGLWRHFARIVEEVQPRFVFIENSPNLRTHGLDVVLEDLARLGFDAEWEVLGAADLGAPHRRDRMWVLGYAGADAFRNSLRVQQGWSRGEGGEDAPEHRLDLSRSVADTDHRPQRVVPVHGSVVGTPELAQALVWPMPPSGEGVAHGLAYRVDRQRATGNGQVARVAAAAWSELLVRAHRRCFGDG